jgi:hypothetical protein
MMNAPDARPAVPAVEARCINPAGSLIGITSSIDKAARSRTFAMTKYSHGFVLTVPKIVPVIPAMTPSPA